MPAQYPARGGGPTTPGVTPKQAKKGLQPCTLTWYDPALGGINSSGGVANPTASMANGKPYNAKAYTCAADPSFAFGTNLYIKANGHSCVVEVTDRGGAISGSHFDLSDAAAIHLGIKAQGKGTGQYERTDMDAGATGKSLGQSVPVIGDITNAANAIPDALGSVTKAIGFLFSKQFLYIFGGGVMLLVALVLVTMHSSAGKAVVSHIPIE